MTHFKATHEPFDYPERHNEFLKNTSIPEPESLYDFLPSKSGRSFSGQQLEILTNRWLNFSKKENNKLRSYVFSIVAKFLTKVTLLFLMLSIFSGSKSVCILFPSCFFIPK